MPPQAEALLLDGSKPPGTRVTVSHATAKNKDGLLIFTNKPDDSWPGIELKGNWSLPPDHALVLELENLGKHEAKIACRLEATGTNAATDKHTFYARPSFAPGEKRRWVIRPPRNLPPQLQEKIFGMRGYPGGLVSGVDGKVSSAPFDPSALVAIRVFLNKPGQAHSIGIRRIFITKMAVIASLNTALDLPPEKFLPMIDRYGQYIHADWPGKIKSDADLQKHRESEEAALAAAPEMPGRSQYGGWAAGPRLKATGHFYATKQNGRWWLVDPDGCLFWSHGVAGVNLWSGITPLSDREHLFAEFPFESCKNQAHWAPHGYYSGRETFQTYNFPESNLRLKYGDDWKRRHFDTTHQRFRAWGLNTLANWTDYALRKLRRTPYTVSLTATSQVIEGSKGFWRKFPDPFHPDFRKNLAAKMARERDAAADPWCIGFFVDNELGWGNDISLSIAALASPETQPAKIALVGMLREKYGAIEKLNAAWKTKHATWDALLAATGAPKEKNKAIASDLHDGYTLIAEKYFSVICEELKKAAPDKLYLGCRFAWVNDLAIFAADKFCDILSFNWYKHNFNGFKLPEGVDKGVVIGEFHFGALDRGMFNGGMCPVANQCERAAAYEKYVRSALSHPNIIGTHWFQYVDQATTGRGADGENFQVGLVDICDTPYPETTTAVKHIGKSMYEIRSEANSQPAAD